VSESAGALAEAVADHEHWLRSVIAARLPNREAVDEVLQEVALAAARAARPPMDPTGYAPWLYRVAVRQVVLYRRRHARQTKLLEGFARNGQPAATSAGFEDPLQWLLSAERHQQVRHALGQLGDRDRQILLMKYAHRLSYSQIARRLGSSDSAIESRLHRARGSLRRCLARISDAVDSTP
jgi:RNA polymerase sigma-70 factor (ECF subfamily)